MSNRVQTWLLALSLAVMVCVLFEMHALRQVVKSIGESVIHRDERDMSTQYTAIHNGVVGPHTVTDQFQDSSHPTETWEQFLVRHARHVADESNGTEYPHYP